jgi:hypothetical protein
MTGKVVSAALLAFVLAGITREQTPPEARDQAPALKPAAAQSVPTIPLSAGTAINASLVSPLDSERSKPGDVVTVLVNESVVYQRCVLLPKGSRIIGHVVRTGSDSVEGAAIFVEFDKAVLLHGEEALLNAGIQALAPPNTGATIPSRKEYEKEWVAGGITAEPLSKPAASPAESMVLPSTYTTPRASVASELPVQKIEGGLDPEGRFTPDSKGAFGEPNISIFTPVSEGSHGTVLVGAQKNVRLPAGTHLLIVIQPPAASPDAR